MSRCVLMFEECHHYTTHLVGLCIVHVQIHYILSTEAHEIVENLAWRNDVSLNSSFGSEAPHCMSLRGIPWSVREKRGLVHRFRQIERKVCVVEKNVGRDIIRRAVFDVCPF